MMKKITFLIIDICVILLFGVYLVTASFIDYPKCVRIIISSVYLLFGVVRVVYYMNQLRK